MRTLLFLVGSSAVAAVVWAQGENSTPPQTIAPPSGGNYVNFGYGGYAGGGTVGGSYLHGMGDVIRSQGQANLDNSAAAINYSAARSQEIDNYKKYTNAYFEARAANRAYREKERGPRPTMEDLVRYAQMGKPDRLSPGDMDVVTGELNWPIVLQSDELADDRAAVEEAFRHRSASGVMGMQEVMKVRQLTDTMLAKLKDNVREIPPNEYIAGKRFLESLAYEATHPTG